MSEEIRKAARLYRYIRSWGRYMRSFEYYITGQQLLAMAEKAPLDAIYKNAQTGSGWTRAADLAPDHDFHTYHAVHWQILMDEPAQRYPLFYALVEKMALANNAPVLTPHTFGRMLKTLNQEDRCWQQCEWDAALYPTDEMQDILVDGEDDERNELVARLKTPTLDEVLDHMFNLI